MIAENPLPIRVLVVDDDEDDFTILRDLIQQIPQQQFQVDWCPDYVHGAEALVQCRHDIYFVDYFLGAKTGIDLLKEGLAHHCKEPIILLTGKGNLKIDHEALALGAFDYLIKSQLTSESVDRCIRYSMQMASTLRRSTISENKFKAIFEKSKDIIFTSTPALEFINVNLAITEVLGHTPDELVLHSMKKLLARKNDFAPLLDKLAEAKELIDYPVELITRDNIKKKCLLSASLEINEAGTTYVQGIIHDISLLKKIEQIKLQSEKLETKGSFIRTLAHEIRNPLHNIILSLGFLKGEATVDNLEFLNVIERNSTRINELINELMDSNQYHKMKLEITSLTNVVKEALGRAADPISLNQIKVIFTPPASEALVLVDREKTKTAFLNIIINAVEAMKIGEGELNISISSGPNTHHVKISDNGCGLSETNVGRLFEPYFTTKASGMGLGLAAAQAIFESLNTGIEVTSVPHKGTTFTLTFPSM